MKTKTMLEHAREFIRFRRNLGYIYKDQATRLESFGAFVDSFGKGQPLTIKLALQWATNTTSQKSYAADRLSTIRPFARHLVASDPRTELIPTRLLNPGNRRADPYIYSQREIGLLMNTVVFPDDQRFSQNTFSTIIGLLSISGIRIGEALSLQRKNIDWNNGTIIVRNSKRLPMRLVPLHASVVNELKRYEKCRECNFPANTSDHFFLSYNGRPMPYQGVRYRWISLLGKMGIGKSRKRRPRIYDLRHTFACNHLLRAYRKNLDIDVAVDSLSTCLGHSSINETYWYLTAVPELQKLCSKRFESHIIATKHENTKTTD